jgi:hypothetical protein
MRAIALTLFMTLLTIGSATVMRAAEVAEKAPKAVVPIPDQDAGVVPAGKMLKFVFPIRNEGNAPLNIFAARADCGCVVPTIENVVEPGQERSVRVEMKTESLYGSIEKHVYIECDDPDQPSLMLTVKVSLPELIQVLPSSQLMLPVTRGKESLARVTLHGSDGQAFRPLVVGCDRPYVKAVLLPTAAGEDPAIAIRVAPDAPEVAFEATVRVQTTHPRCPWLKFKVFGQPEGAVTVQPPRLEFGHLRPDGPTPVTRLVALSRRQGAFKVLGVEASDPALKVTLDGDATPRYCEVQVAYVGGWTQQRIAGTIVIRTDDPVRPRIEVPYTAEVW